MKFLLRAITFVFLSFTQICFANSPIKVAIIDTGLDLSDSRFSKVLCKQGHKDFTNTGLVDNLGHGTHIAGLIKKYAQDANYCIVIIKYFDHNTRNQGLLTKSIIYAKSLKVDIVNISSSGSEPDDAEEAAMRSFKNTIFVVAAGNDHEDALDPGTYPAAYDIPNMRVIGALNESGTFRWIWSNFGLGITAWEIGELVYSTLPGGRWGTLSGTSQATAIHSGRLTKELSDAHNRCSGECLFY